MKTIFKSIIVFSIFTIIIAGWSIGMYYYVDHIAWYPNAPTIIKGKTHIACIGDSITYGAGVWFERDKYTYEVLLNNMLGEEYQVLNYGLNGRTLLSEADYPYINETFYPITHNVEADIYIIMLGSNDSKPFNWQYAGTNGENYKRQLKEFLNSYINLANSPRVMVMQPPKAYPIDGVIPYEISDDVIKGELHTYIEEVANELDIPVINLYGITENHAEWFPDGIHPNKDGNLAIAQEIYKYF